MKKLLLLIVVSLTLAGMANAGSNTWNPSVLDPNWVGDFGNWDVAANWSYGTVPLSNDKTASSNDTLGVGCVIDSDTTDAVTGQFVWGDNGPGAPVVHELTIYGDLHTCVDGESWSACGYNRASIISVERGGSLTTGNRLGVGLVDDTAGAGPVLPTSTFNVNGGTVTINGNLQLGEVPGTNPVTPGHIGLVNVNSGTLDVLDTLEFRDPDSPDWGVIDIRHGILTVADDPCSLGPSPTSNLVDLIANGNITAFGGTSTVLYDYVGGTTTITAVDQMNRYPAMDDWIADGGVTLSWANLAPVPPAWTVWVDVWFGTDTDPCNYVKVLGQQMFTESLGTSTTPGDYWWQVDSYIYGDPASTVYKYPGDPNFENPLDPRPPIIVGDQLIFHSTDDEPPEVVITTLPTVTWANQPTTLDATVYDDGTSAVKVIWSVDPSLDPNVVFTPVQNDIPAQADYQITGVPVSTSMTCNFHAAQFTVTATASDAINPDADSSNLGLDCAENACQAARGPMNLDEEYPGDIAPYDLDDPDVSVDCLVDSQDLLVLVADWLYDYAISGPTEIPQQ